MSSVRGSAVRHVRGNNVRVRWPSKAVQPASTALEGHRTAGTSGNRSCLKRFVRRWLGPAVLLLLAGLSCCDRVKAGDLPAATVSERAADIETDSKAKTAICRVELADPVFPSMPVRLYPVVQSRDRNGFPVGYALAVKTDVCMDKKCKTIEVIMHWNALGYYERLECPPHKPLTKKEHIPFDGDDYAKLDRILRDGNSILGRHSLAFLAKPVEDATGVDAWTGATPLTVQASVVKDAAYTTWVMWRWANGEIVQKLRRLTEQDCTPPYLRVLLRSEDRRNVDFALKYVVEHHGRDAQFLDDVVHVLETGDREHIILSLRFLTGLMKNKETLHARLIESCCRMQSMYSPIVLDHLAADPELPRTTLEGLTGRLDQLPYFQVHLILRLLERRKFFSKKTQSDVCQLLDGDDFFIGRRACEHLMKQNLDSETQRKVNAFRQRYRDRL